MPDAISGVSPIAIDRTNPDHPRRDPQDQQPRGSRRHPARPSGQATPAAADPDPPVVGSRLNVHA
jgi:hypothetical protein